MKNKGKFKLSHKLFPLQYLFQQTRYINSDTRKIYKLNPWWITGFVDAEGSFTMSINESKTSAIGWTIGPAFIITLHSRDLDLLYSIKEFFSVGSVSLTKKGAQFRVRSKSELNIIIEHFKKYPLVTTKALNFIYFCEIFELINKKVHLNISGFLKLASLINKLNKPLSNSLLSRLAQLGTLPNVDFETISNIEIAKNLDPFWISGFATGEGSFTYFIKKRTNYSGNLVKDYSLVFEVSQKTQDIQVLTLIKSYFNKGNVYTDSKGISRYRLRANLDNMKSLMYHFDNYPLIGHKHLQYLSWLDIVNILINQKSRTAERDIEIENLIQKLSNLN